MAFIRFSAVENFGVPIDSTMGMDKPDVLIRLMEDYGIEGQEVPREATEITPYYWRNPVFKYYASLAHPEGPAIIDLLPRHADSEAYMIGRVATLQVMVPGVRTIEIPTDQQAMAIVGPGPRFAGQLCVHEIITYTH